LKRYICPWCRRKNYSKQKVFAAILCKCNYLTVFDPQTRLATWTSNQYRGKNVSGGHIYDGVYLNSRRKSLTRQVFYDLQAHNYQRAAID
jgi:hypothetical protein